MDFLQARYMGATQGRFLSADPGNAGADPTNPQSWNGYSYVLNNPLTLIDPTGYCSVGPDGIARDDEPGDCGGGSTTVYGGPPDSILINPCFFCAYISGNGTQRQQSPPPPPPIVPTIFSITVTGNPPKNVARPDWLNKITGIFGYDQRIPLPSCFGGFLSEVLENINPFSPSPQAPTAGQIVTTTYGTYKFNQALQYAAKTPSNTFGTPFWVYPNKSSAFRSMLDSAKKVGLWEELLDTVDVAMFQALISEIQDMRHGSCQ